MNHSRFFFVLFLLLGLSGCESTYNWRGNFPSKEQVEKIQVGGSSKADVLKILGAPTHRQLFDGNGWYYVGEENEVTAFLDPEVLKRQVVHITFDAKGYVTNVSVSQGTDAKEVSMQEDKTPTLGRDPAFFKEFFGTIGKYDEGKHKSGHA